MPRVGNAFRQAVALDAAARELCECGHPRGEHRELAPDTLALVDGRLVEVVNPDYRPFHFHCGHEGCPCVVDRSA